MATYEPVEVLESAPSTTPPSYTTPTMVVYHTVQRVSINIETKIYKLG